MMSRSAWIAVLLLVFSVLVTALSWMWSEGSGFVFLILFLPFVFGGRRIFGGDGRDEEGKRDR